MHSIRVLAFAALFGLLVSSPARAVLLTNGDFETPTVPVGDFTNFAAGSAGITGWTVVGNAGTDVSIVSGTFTQNGFSFPAESGVQWVDLTGDGSNSDTEGVEQTVATTPSTDYSLSFWVGNVVNPGGIFGTTSTVDVLINGTQVDAAENTSGSGTTTLNWEQFTVPFSATSSTTTIALLNGDPAGDNSNGLDNVSLTQGGVVSAVPLPPAMWPSLAMFAGLLGVKRLLRRRAGRLA